MSLESSFWIRQARINPPHAAVTMQPIALVIDDSDDCLQIATHVLEQLGCHCLTATTAQEGLSLAIASTPDIILLDLVLPDCSGLELLNQFKQQEQAILATVIAVTAAVSWLAGNN